jgi:hypothetical protein
MDVEGRSIAALEGVPRECRGGRGSREEQGGRRGSMGEHGGGI